MRGHLQRLNFLLVAAFVLQGCSSSPPVHYYSLEPMPVEYSRDADDAIVLGLGPLRLADYLKRSQMVTRGADAEIVVDELNRWAEPLSTAIQRIVAANVDSLLDSVAVVGFPDTDTAEIDYRVIGRVHRFDVDTAGAAVLLVQWRIEDADGRTVTPPRRDRYEAAVRRVGDPAAHAAALTDTLGGFSRDIAGRVRDVTAAGTQ